MKKTDILGEVPDVRSDYDKMSVVMICLNEKLQDKDDKNLTKLLNTVFSESMSVEEKKRILSEEYDIPVDIKMEGGLRNMCNLSEGIWRRGVEEGMQQGMRQERIDIFKLISSMFNAGETVETVKRLTEDEKFYEDMQKKYLYV